jgi:predicted deacylase
VSAPSPLSSAIPEFLIARFGRDDLNLDRQQHDSAELEAPTTGLINDPRMVGGDVAHGVDLIVVLPIGEGCDSASRVSSARPGVPFGNRTRPL